ncbi:ribosome small subunit-dependent GTPase A [uncultured Draconibacterium sp.]|uniref:ribosome small subunit-dependent GTPase A n=1 Tax=uncultured Draconibacterium sp. TaxID=1573823 RepID=UPI0025EE83AA|nr:ribosome small subunit-dependent GTPase A [uncultured Draconibacterium sp.]
MNKQELPQELIEYITDNQIEQAELARVIAEHKERYNIRNNDTIYSAEITGNIRFTANSSADFPAVGDWVRFTKMDESSAIILEVLPRFSVLQRQAVGKHAEVQLIAANVDVAFIVQAVGHDFNLNRLERYLSVCFAGKIKPIIIISKTDLADEIVLKQMLQEIATRQSSCTVISLSNQSKKGLDSLEQVLEPYKTYCFLGSSGVGKSTIINHLLGVQQQEVKKISESTSKGRHTTSHRELFVLKNNSIVIDTPGMRELGITHLSNALENTFDNIAELATQCKFNDCSHMNETGCAIISAVESGELSEDSYQNYLKLKREQAHFSSTVYEKRQRAKDFGKMVKSILQEKKQSK